MSTAVSLRVVAGAAEHAAARDPALIARVRDATDGALELAIDCHDGPRAVQLAPGPPPPHALVHAGIVPRDFMGYDAGLREVAGSIVALSVSTDVAMPAWRHRDSGWVIAALPAWEERWGERERAFLASHCDALPPDPIERVAAALVAAAKDVLARGAAAVALFNAFAFVDRETAARAALHDRIIALDLAVARVSASTGAYVVDVDRVLGFVGARTLETDWRAEGPRARQLVAGELGAIAIEAAAVVADLDAAAARARYRGVRVPS